MPALSPTMTEGNIAQWRVKEGDSYSAGDVLLEIETDKATMDVEAQDDGIMVKIMSPDGSKAVPVGSRIAVTGESGDDASSLEIPEHNTSKAAPSKESQEEKKDTKAKEPERSSENKSAASERPKQSKTDDKAPVNKARKQKYPFYPSVQHLLHQHGLSAAEADDIPASGPNGRLLKGDILAHLGQINKDYPAEASARLQKLSHLDLSNIKIAAPSPKPAEEPVKAAPQPDLPQETELALPISLDAVMATQKRVQDALHTTLPLSVFIARASELANEDLPLSARAKPSKDDLFNAVLGLPYSQKTSSRGRFVPELSSLDLSSVPQPSSSKQSSDIIDILTGARSSRPKTPRRIGRTVGAPTSENLFSVTAKPGEEERAMVYLERMKYALEKDPGRLVL